MVKINDKLPKILIFREKKLCNIFNDRFTIHICYEPHLHSVNICKYFSENFRQTERTVLHQLPVYHTIYCRPN